MANSIENKVSSYQVSEDTKDMFANLSIFAKNCEIKNTEKYDEQEDAISKWMGDLIVKYFNGGINHEDILALLKFIKSYNEILKEQQNDETGSYYIESILRLTLQKNRDNYDDTEIASIYQNSIFKVIVDNLKIWMSEIISPSQSDNSELAEIFKNKIEIEKEKIIASSLWAYAFSSDSIFRANSESESNEESNSSGGEPVSGEPAGSAAPAGAAAASAEEGSGESTGSDDSTSTTEIHPAFNNILDDRYLMINYSDYKPLVEAKIKSLIEEDYVGDFKNLIDTMKNKDKYFILGYKNVTMDTAFEKLSASSKEVLNAENGENQVFFDLIFRGSEEIKKLLSDITGKTNDQTPYFSIVIPYKELNSLYRDTLDSEILDIIFYLNKDKVERSLLTPENGYCVTNSTFSVLRSYKTSDYFLFRDFYSDGGFIKNTNNNITKTTRLAAFQYTNPYIARRSAESEIIKYYIGDDYISNNYGQYNYERLEIATFLEKYKTIRDYYYKVLLNESFINEPAYKLYEKEFLFFWAIEQTITSKVDNIRNIDTFDLTDIKNFLVSYGLDDLYDIINSGPFLDREVYSKRILKSYIDLIQYKGSRGILDILENIFSIDDKTLKIYRQVLIKKEEKDGKTSYKIIRVDRSISNILSVLKNDETSADMDLVTSRDKYWKVESTNELDMAKLDSANADYVNTKYIVPEMTIEISKYYFTSRIFFALIDKLLENDTIEDNNEGITINISKDAISSMKLKNYLDCFRIIYKKYFLKFLAENLINSGKDNQYNWPKGNGDEKKDPFKVFRFDDSFLTDPDIRATHIEKEYNLLYELYDEIDNIISIDDNKNITNLDTDNETFLSIYYKYAHSTSLLNEEYDTINYFIRTIYIIKHINTILNDLSISSSENLTKITFIIIGLSYRIFNGYLNHDQIKEEKVLYDAIMLFFDKIFIEPSSFISLEDDQGQPGADAQKIKKFSDNELEGKVETSINDKGTSGKVDIFEPSYRYNAERFSTLMNLINGKIITSYAIEGTIKDADAEALYSILIGMLDSLNEKFSNISVTLGANDVKLSEFLRQTIVYFISYTSEVFNNTLSTVISYDNKLDTYEVQDYIKDITLSSSLADSFYYDEELFIKEEN